MTSDLKNLATGYYEELKKQLSTGRSKDPLIRFSQFIGGYRFDKESRTVVKNAEPFSTDKPVAQLVNETKKVVDKHLASIITQVEKDLTDKTSTENEAKVLAGYKSVFGSEIDELIRKRSDEMNLDYAQFRSQVYRFAKLNMGVVPKGEGGQFGQTNSPLQHLIEQNMHKALSRNYEQNLQLCKTAEEAGKFLKSIEPELEKRSFMVEKATRNELEQIIKFWENIDGNGKKPRLYQAIRAYEIVHRGTKRMVCADATASGKTYTALLIKQLLDAKQGKRHKVLLVAPEQALLNAWADEIRESFPEYKLLHIKSRHDMADIDSADIVGVNYQKFGYCQQNKNPYVRQMLRKAQDGEFGMIVFDEIQSIKNPFAQRTDAIESILKAANKTSPYILGLSATMPHNTLKDLGVPLHILFPYDYPLKAYDVRGNPWAIKEAKIAGRWRALSRDDLRNIVQLPVLETYPKSPAEMKSRDLDSMLGEWEKDPQSKRCLVELQDKACDEYMKIWADGDMHLYEKVHKLRRILVENKLPYVEQLVKDILAKEPNAQIAIYSYLRKNITDKLAEKLSTNDISAKYIDGDTKSDDRQKIARGFRSGANKILVATTKTTGESITLCAGENPIYAVMLEPCFDPGDSSQIPGRFCRQQQKAPVKILTLLSYSPTLTQRMNDATDQLEKHYKVKFKATWRPSTIDVDLYEILQFKAKINRDFAQKDIVPKDIDELVGNFDPTRKKSLEEIGELLIKSLPPSANQKPGIDFVNGFKASAALYGKGSKTLFECDEGTSKLTPSFDKLVKGYKDEVLLQTVVGVNNRFLSDILEHLEAKYISDWGCGTAPLARVLRRPIVNLDLSRKMLESAQAACQKEGLPCGKIYDYIKGQKPKLPKDGVAENYFIRSFMQDTPFARDSLDAITISCALHYDAQGGEKENREIEDIVLEASRVLKPNGYLLLSLTPTFTCEKDFEATKELLGNYEFNIVPEITAFWKSKEKGSKGAFYILGQKIATAKSQKKETFDIFVTSKHRATGGQRYFNPWRDHTPHLFDRQPEYVNKDGKSLREVIENIGGMKNDI